MNLAVEQIGRQDPDFIHHVYRIRKSVFEDEFGYPEKDRLVYSEWDALSNHYLLITNGEPTGTISVIDLTGLTDIIEAHNLDPSLRIAKATRFAIMHHVRGIRSLKRLLQPVFSEIKGYDFVVGHVGPPSNNLEDDHLHKMGRKYGSVFGAQQLGNIEIDGIQMLVYGLDLRTTKDFF